MTPGNMSPARRRLLTKAVAHTAEYVARKAAGTAKPWEGPAYRPRGVRGFAAAANAAERDGLVIVFRDRNEAVDGVVVTAAGREALANHNGSEVY